MARSDEQTNLRFTKDLKDWLRARAKENKRSINAEVVVCLEAAKREESQKEVQHEK